MYYNKVPGQLCEKHGNYYRLNILLGYIKTQKHKMDQRLPIK